MFEGMLALTIVMLFFVSSLYFLLSICKVTFEEESKEDTDYELAMNFKSNLKRRSL